MQVLYQLSYGPIVVASTADHFKSLHPWGEALSSAPQQRREPPSTASQRNEAPRTRSPGTTPSEWGPAVTAQTWRQTATRRP
jgi:hypothetical protein